MLGEIDVSIGAAPVDLATAAVTAKRISMSEVKRVLVVFVKGVGASGENPVLTVKQHTAASGGTSTNCACVDRFWTKAAVALAGTEIWTEVTQALAATVAPGNALNQAMVAFEIRPDDLASGNSWMSVDIGDVGVGVQLGTLLYLIEPSDAARPAELVPPLR